jgi:hypothetical protein
VDHFQLSECDSAGFKGSSNPLQNRRIKILKNYISCGSVCELETQILLAGDLDLIEKGELDTFDSKLNSD